MSKIDKVKKVANVAEEALKKLFKESPDAVERVLKEAKGEAAPKLGAGNSGKNLEALQRAKSEAPLNNYPANKNVDKPEFRTVGEPQTKDFTIVPEGTNLPAVRGNTLPEALPKGGPVALIPEVMDDVGPMLPAVRKTSMPVPMNDVQDVTSGGLSTLSKLGIGAGMLGLGGSVLMNEQPQKAEAMGALPPIAAAATTAVVDNLMAPKPQLPRSPAVEAPMADIQAPEQAAPQASQDDYLKMLQAAQSKQDQDNFIDNMLRAGTTIGAGIAGQQADYSGVDALQKQNGIGVQNVKDKMTADMDSKKLKKVQEELNDDAKLRDPKSDVSAAFRQALVKLGVKHSDKTSAADAKAMGINIQNLLMHEKTIAASEAKADRKASGDIDKYIAGSQKVLLKPYQSYQKVAVAKKALDGYLKGASSGPKDVAILYNFIKGLDPDSAVKEGEIELGKSAMSLFDKYGIQAKKLYNSDVLSPKFRTAIADILKGQEEQAREVYEKTREPYLRQAVSMGLDSDQLDRLDYLSADEKRTKGDALKQNPDSTVGGYTEKEKAAIELVMTKNNVSEAEAVAALKKAKKIK